MNTIPNMSLLNKKKQQAILSHIRDNKTKCLKDNKNYQNVALKA